MSNPSTMEDRQLSTILASGELSAIYLGGITGEYKVLTSDEIRSLLQNGTITDIYIGGTDPENKAATIGDIDRRHTFGFAQDHGVVITSDTYAGLLTMTASNMPKGYYKIELSIIHSYDDTQSNAYLRFRTNGGVWTELAREPKDQTDNDAASYSYIFEQTADGTLTVEMEARCEVAGKTLTFAEVNIIAELKEPT